MRDVADLSVNRIAHSIFAGSTQWKFFSVDYDGIVIWPVLLVRDSVDAAEGCHLARSKVTLELWNEAAELMVGVML
jgi:hypothetical protein